MKHTFSIRRLFLLSRIHLTGFLPSFIGASAILVFIVFYISLVSGYSTDNYILFFPFVYFFAGCLYASAFYGSWANKGHAFSFLTIPASVKEKFVVSLVFTSIVYTLIFSLLYFGTAYILGNAFHPSFTVKELLFSDGSDSRIASFSYTICFIEFLIAQSLFLLGSIMLNKRQFSYSAIVVFLLIIVIYPGQQYVAKLFTGWNIWGTHSILMIGGHLYVYNGKYMPVTMNETIGMGSYVFWILIPVLIYYAAYLKLKEKEL
jgi:hypothetical protein